MKYLVHRSCCFFLTCWKIFFTGQVVRSLPIFTTCSLPNIFVSGEVVGALPVAHEPSSFSVSLLLLSFLFVAIFSALSLDLALCLIKDRGDIKIYFHKFTRFMFCQDFMNISHLCSSSFQRQMCLSLSTDSNPFVSGFLFKGCTFVVSNVYRYKKRPFEKNVKTRISKLNLTHVELSSTCGIIFKKEKPYFHIGCMQT